MTSAPLVLGFDLANRSLLAKNYPIIGNRAAIAINQAWGGHPGRLVKNASKTFVAAVGHGAGFDGCERMEGPRMVNICENISFPVTQVWAKPLSATEHAVLLINLSEEPQSAGVTLAELGLSWGAAAAADVWTGKEAAGGVGRVGLPPHGSAFLRLRLTKRA